MPPKLLVVTTSALTLHFLLPHAKHFRDEGWRVDAATSGEVPPSYEDAFDNIWMIDWSRRIYAPTNFLRAPVQLRRLVEDLEPDIIHTHTPIASWIVRATAATIPRRRRPAVVYTAHGFHFHPGGSRLGNAFYRAAEKVAGKATDVLVVLNETDEQAAQRHRLVPPERIVHMRGIGVDLDWYRKTPEVLEAARRLRHDLKIPPGSPVVTMVAEMRPGKNHAHALAAIERCRSEPHLVLVGDGRLRPDIEKLVAESSVAHRVHLLGEQGDPRPAMAAADATLLPSVREGVSRAVLESLAMGVPVVGSDVRGIADVVDARTGALVPVGDIGALADAIDAVLTRPAEEWAESMAEARPDLERYSLESVIKQHQLVYEATGRIT